MSPIFRLRTRTLRGGTHAAGAAQMTVGRLADLSCFSLRNLSKQKPLRSRCAQIKRSLDVRHWACFESCHHGLRRGIPWLERLARSCVSAHSPVETLLKADEVCAGLFRDLALRRWTISDPMAFQSSSRFIVKYPGASDMHASFKQPVRIARRHANHQEGQAALQESAHRLARC